jgi:hypothetical protein
VTELCFGSATEKIDGHSNTFTKDGFMAMLSALKTMPKLTTLDMQLLYVKDLRIDGKGKYSLFDLGINERGAQFVVQNFKNLTKLDISKQWSDSDNNNVGGAGAIVIANKLTNLIELDISKQWSHSDNNNVGDSGVIAIANKLINLTILVISKQ